MCADPETVERQLVELIRKVQPAMILTFEPYGIYGHPDHVAISKFTTEAFDLAGDPDFFPEGGDPWQPKNLFYLVMATDWFKRVRDHIAVLNLDPSGLDNLAQYLKPATDAMITHRLNVSEFVPVKMESLRCHKTQIGPQSAFYHLLRPEFAKIHAEEMFIQVWPESRGGDFFSL